MEIWSKILINNEESDYEISTFGRVRNINKLNWKNKGILKPKFNKANGYYSYNLTVNHKKYTKYIHRLVAQAFIPNPDNLPQVNHIDGNKGNNHLNNLEWCSGKYNMKHAFKNELVATAKSVTIYTLKGNKIKDFESISEAVRFIIKNSNNEHRLAVPEGILDQEITNTNRQFLGVQWRLRDNDIRPVYDIPETCQKVNIPIVKMTMDNIVIKTYPQIHMAYIEMGKIDNGAISQVCKGRYKSFNGFKWMYYSDFIEQYKK